MTEKLTGEKTYTGEEVHVSLAMESLGDLNGLGYFGIEVPEEPLKKYLDALYLKLGEEEYRKYESAKAARDGVHHYHLTVVRPPEMTPALKEKAMEHIRKGTKFNLAFKGIGSITKGEGENKTTAYYVVVESPEVNAMRAELGLPAHWLHITLGFYPNDIYDLPKWEDTLKDIPVHVPKASALDL